MKTCSSCGKTKDLSSFSKNATKKDGMQTHCKVCRSEKRKLYYKENKVKELSLNKEWNKQNPTKS